MYERIRPAGQRLFRSFIRILTLGQDDLRAVEPTPRASAFPQEPERGTKLSKKSTLVIHPYVNKHIT